MLENSPLGQATTYIETYSPELLFPLPRALGREKLSIEQNLPFNGYDLWNGYELSWLNLKGKPQIATIELLFPCTSEKLIESKSLKLYLNSFNQSNFSSALEVKNLIEKDLSTAVKASVQVTLVLPTENRQMTIQELHGKCLDDLDVAIESYEVDKTLLSVKQDVVDDEEIYTNLLKSNCLATGQPDWGSLYIKYSGNKICHENLLKYVISYRKHAGFHEHCVEQIFIDILDLCSPKKLTVYARYTRRGGLDINPFRSNAENLVCNPRLYRQ